MITALTCKAAMQNPSGGSGGLTAQTVTNITSASLTVTGQGSNVLNVEGGGGSFNTNAPVFWTTGATNTFNAPTFTSNMNVRAYLGVNTNTTVLWTNDDYVVWFRPHTGNTLYPTTARVGVQGDQGSQFVIKDQLNDYNHTMGFDGANNFRWVINGSSLGDAYFSVNATVPLRLSTSTITLGNSSSFGVTMNAATMAIPNNLNIGSGVLNLTASAGITNNTSGIYSRGTIASSNFFMFGGMTVNRRQVSANTTNLPGDYNISFKGVTAATVTNFIATNGLASGSMLIIKDGARTAGTTNIVLFPMNTTFIDGASAYSINGNGNSQTLIFDGVNNWELN